MDAGSHSSEIQFKIRHLVITNVSGSFGKFSAEVDSITTNNEQRDAHLKSADFFEIAIHPKLLFVSTKSERVTGEEYTLLKEKSVVRILV